MLIPGALAQTNEGLLDLVNGAEVINGSNSVVVPAVTDSASVSSVDNSSADPVPGILIQGNVYDAQRFVIDQIIPVAGASIFFISNDTDPENATIFVTVSDPTGFYSIILAPGEYTQVVSAPGFSTVIDPDTFTKTRSKNILLFPVPFNGFTPYARNPVLETSPGKDIDCVIVVLNSQVIDQMVTASIVTPDGWIAWFPNGEALMVPSGYVGEIPIRLRYEGSLPGPHTMKVVVNGGSYFAEVPVIVVVKDLPDERIDLYATSDCHQVTPGMETWYQIMMVNYYHTGKQVFVDAKPEIPSDPIVVTAWDKETIEITNSFFVYKYSSLGTQDVKLRVFVPAGTWAGEHVIRVTVRGDGVRSNTLFLHVTVKNEKLLDVSILDADKRDAGDQPSRTDFTIVKGHMLNLTVRATNNWLYPLKVTVKISPPAFPRVDWKFNPVLASGLPAESTEIMPGTSADFFFHTAIPNATTPGRYTIGVDVTREEKYWTTIKREQIPVTVDVINGSPGNGARSIFLDEFTLSDSTMVFLIPAFLLAILLVVLYRWPDR